ncbi:integrin alpha-9 [Octopus bimaculoides]|uniref:Integrin alpha second immunoglobulin-like domain-containing protein n=1 Tax=Octopus bimaculoides TaxID=37653 RepID=A0A0L8IFB9_OCTBM|nr:integrin alpha-9 [Octopus bimaculoides]|eukprot:XP_014773510.1 PREDICTED: integrin alpha-9-like [Octopus bimaculoides]
MVAEGDSCRSTASVIPLLLLLLSTFVPLAFTFNIDTRNAFILSGPNGSYFGYSLAFYQHPQQQQNCTLIVGAPKFKEGANTHGKIFSCSVQQTNSCQPIDVQFKTKNGYGYSKNDLWIGGTMDTNEQKNKVMICAHRYTILLLRSQRMTGICLEMSDATGQDTRMLECQADQKRNGVYYYGVAQLGTSMKYSKDNKTLLFGTPGLYQGKGGFAIYNENGCEVVDYSDETRNIVHTDDEYEYQMVGYSITSGRYFNNQVHTVVGAPGISTSGLGKIYFYSGGTLFQYYKGTQFGSGFGSSLLTADLTGDGNDDLIVGAPYQYSIKNEGHVHVFISTGWGLFHRSELQGDNIVNAHFGMALGNLGDINKDGFEDIVVGAPYEEDCGAIYIYFGNNLKLNENNRQKILGKTLDSNLKGFGISFSKPMDVDGNGYDDFFAGAFLSDNAVLLSSREIKAKSRITTNPGELDPSDVRCFGEIFISGCLDLQLCIKLIGKNLKNIKTTIITDVDVDQEKAKKRVALEGSNTNEIILQSEEERCISMALKTRKTNNIFSSVIMQFRVAYSINETCVSCSAENLLDTTLLTKEIPFVTECGKDKICYSELVPNLQIVNPRTNDILVIGESFMFEVRVTVRNMEEAAYQPIGILRYPLYVQYIPNSATNGVNCSAESIVLLGEEKNKVVKCNLKNPIRQEDFTYNMTFEIEEGNLKFGMFPMKFSVTSQSEEMCNKNDAMKLTVKMRKKAQLLLSGSSEPAFIVVSDKRNKSSGIQNVAHKYVFYNKGPSDITKVQFSGSVKTIFQEIKGKPVRIVVDAILKITQKESLPVLSCNESKLEGNQEEYRFNCEVHNFSATLSFNVEIKLKLFTRFTNSDLTPVFSDIMISEHKNEQFITGIQNTEMSVQVGTNLRPDRKHIKIWIIILCVALGVFLLILVICGLRKCGFFERQKVHHIRGHSGKMRQLSQPDPDDDNKE